MYKIDLESIKKLLQLNNYLNQLEVKGASNVSILYDSMVILQQIIKNINDNNKIENGITIDNTK